MEIFFAKADEILNIVSQHSPLWIYFFVLASMIFENFFPPYPGDLVVFICAAYAAAGNASWTLIWILSIIGTMISVMGLFYVGRTKGRDIFHSKRVRFLGVKRLEKVEHLYHRWGERLLLLSRWITGVRALIALFAGVGKVKTSHMFFYTLISTLAFNTVLLYLALRLRQDAHKIESILGAYNDIVIILIVVLALLVGIKLLKRRRPSAL